MHFGGRSKHNKELIKILREVFASRARDEWIKIFEERKVEFGYAPINTMEEAVKDPQVIKNDYVIDFDRPALGKIKLVGFLIEFSETPSTNF